MSDSWQSRVDSLLADLSDNVRDIALGEDAQGGKEETEHHYLSLSDEIGNEISQQISAHISAQIDAQLQEQLDAQLEEQLRVELDAELTKQLDEQFERQMAEQEMEMEQQLLNPTAWVVGAGAGAEEELGMGGEAIDDIELLATGYESEQQPAYMQAVLAGTRLRAPELQRLADSLYGPQDTPIPSTKEKRRLAISGEKEEEEEAYP
ncbi:unnamed protein product [Chrysoparadoxa australica]